MQNFILNKERNVTLTALLQPIYEEVGYIKKRPAILILPGGGYRFCSDREAEPVAYQYLKAGYHAFVLRYSVKPNVEWPDPLNDYEQAMELIKAHAEEWHLLPDKIAVIGFSAGGHLAAMAATTARNKPVAAILGYPAVKKEYWKGVSPCECVTEKTSPCFVFATRNDNIIPINNSLGFLDALDKKGISFECHIYSYGPHGLSTADSSIQLQDNSFTPRVKNWVEDSIAWLKEIMGDFGVNGLTEPACTPRINDDYAEYLSLNCTVEFLYSVEKAKLILEPLFSQMITKFARSNNIADTIRAETEFRNTFGHIVFKQLIGYLNVSEDEIRECNKKLKKVENPKFN